MTCTYKYKSSFLTNECVPDSVQGLEEADVRQVQGAIRMIQYNQMTNVEEKEQQLDVIEPRFGKKGLKTLFFDLLDRSKKKGCLNAVLQVQVDPTGDLVMKSLDSSL